MPDVEATKVPAGMPNAERWTKPVTPFTEDVHETIHELVIAVEPAVTTAVEAKGKLATVWAGLRK